MEFFEAFILRVDGEEECRGIGGMHDDRDAEGSAEVEDGSELRVIDLPEAAIGMAVGEAELFEEFEADDTALVSESELFDGGSHEVGLIASPLAVLGAEWILAMTDEIDVGEEGNTILEGGPQIFEGRFEVTAERGIKATADGDPLSIHDLEVAVAGFGLELKTDTKVGVEVDGWEGSERGCAVRGSQLTEWVVLAEGEIGIGFGIGRGLDG